MFRHILIPTDGSQLAEKAIRYGIALAKTSLNGLRGSWGWFRRLRRLPASRAIP
jgi:hypothetical protein